MSNIGKPERETQNRVIALFRDELHYRYLGDRAELDKQIQGVFADAGEAIHRTSSGHDLMAQLSQVKPRLLCSLVHKFGEAVEDGVVLDLVYEARDIEQSFGSQDKIDAWFEAKTKGLNDWQNAECRKAGQSRPKVEVSATRSTELEAPCTRRPEVCPAPESSRRGNAAGKWSG